jgi:hypothetical protein
LSLLAAALTGGCSSDSKSGSGGDASTGGSAAAGASNGGNAGSGGGSSGATSGSGGGGNACTGGPGTGPTDDHCNGDSGPIVQPTGTCQSDVADAGGAADGGAEETTPGPWGGTSSSDDDCKYDVTYSVTPICENQDVTFTVTLKSRVTHSGVTGASPYLEVLDPDGIPAAEGAQTPTETSPGTYEIKPIRFNKKGKWTVRFHFFETCSDAPEDSPHGHAAFFIDVP